MAGGLFDQGQWFVHCSFFIFSINYVSFLGFFLSDSSNELSSAVKSQEDIVTTAKEAASALEEDQDVSNLIIGMGLGFGSTIVVLLICVLARFFRCFKYVFKLC